MGLGMKLVMETDKGVRCGRGKGERGFVARYRNRGYESTMRPAGESVKVWWEGREFDYKGCLTIHVARSYFVAWLQWSGQWSEGRLPIRCHEAAAHGLIGR